MKVKKIILIGNYKPDKQESMIRFAHLLNAGFCNAKVDVEIWWPTILAGRMVKSTNTGLGKWLGYLDKYLIFPVILKWRMRNKHLKESSVRFHICDHSNAPYATYFPSNYTSITCHDVIAIRGAMGYVDSHQPASAMGKLLQKWILKNLKIVKSIVFVSQHSFDQFKELVPIELIVSKNYRVIHNAFNNDFKPMDKIEAREKLIAIGIDTDTPFVLHVGSGSKRKNRNLLLDMVSILNKKQNLNICYAGEGLNQELIEHAKAIGVDHQLISIIQPDHNTLVALYSLCKAFIFPSLSEGFGWPLIEAQACGAPVIASATYPMPEVSGGAALHFDPLKPQDFATGFNTLSNDELRQNLIESGFKNSLRFKPAKMIEAYLHFINLY